MAEGWERSRVEYAISLAKQDFDMQQVRVKDYLIGGVVVTLRKEGPSSIATN